MPTFAMILHPVALARTNSANTDSNAASLKRGVSTTWRAGGAYSELGFEQEGQSVSDGAMMPPQFLQEMGAAAFMD
jgi:hypothetical protein